MKCELKLYILKVLAHLESEDIALYINGINSLVYACFRVR